MSRTPMKLILTQEVSGLGAPGDVVDVASGYGRNYLIPRGFAMRWTRGAEKQVDLIRRARSVREIRSLDDAKAAAAELQNLMVRLPRRAGTNGRLFGSVGPADIAERGPCRRRPRTRPSPDRGPRPDQDRRHAPGEGPAASGGQCDHRYRGRRSLITRKPAVLPGDITWGAGGFRMSAQAGCTARKQALRRPFRTRQRHRVPGDTGPGGHGHATFVRWLVGGAERDRGTASALRWAARRRR